MEQIKDPPESYILQQDGDTYYVTEYDDDDVEVRIEYESPIEKLGYVVVYHAVTLDERISDGAYRLYNLYHYWAQQKGRAWPSLKTLAEHLNKSKPSVVAYNKELEAAGYIYRSARKSDAGDRLSSLVTIRAVAQNTGLKQLAADIFVNQRDIPLVQGGGGKKSLQRGQSIELGGQSTCQEELTKEEVTKEEKAASPPQKSFSPPPADEQYRVEYYYKDKSAVRTIGTVSNGPWSVECICGGDVVIDSLETGTPCLCGQREFVLSRHKPKAVVKRKHPAVEAYYSIAKSRGVRYGSQDDELEKRIAQTVTDIPFWRQVVVEYIARWSPLNILIMLQYYEESRLPGTRKGEEGGGETTHTELPAYEPDFSDITKEDIAETLASLRDMEECLL